jgi:hypothetical protein
MIQCLMVDEHGGTYHKIPDAEVEDWEDILDAIDGEPQLIERVQGWPPYTHAYRLPTGSIYLVALGTPD